MLIVGNWKVYVQSKDTAKKIVAAAKRALLRSKVKVAVAPAAPYLGLFAGDKRSKIALAAQDVSETTTATATGEVAAGVLRSLDVQYVIVGHSERRAQGETDALVAEKVQRVLANGMMPIVCVGEQERDADAEYLGVLRAQIDAVFAPLSPQDRLRVVLAYEPVWAISGKASAEVITSVELAEMVLYIRKILSTYLPGTGAAKVRILYGGSADAENIRELAGGSRVDGFLVGHASTDPSSFAALIKAVS